MHEEFFEITQRFCGPPRSGNGGYVAGRIARHLPGSVAVRLKAPPPLGSRLRLTSSDEEARLFEGDTLIGEGRTAALDLTPPAPPSFEAATAASAGFLGFRSHPFPGCFVCGPAREPADGLRIFPGPTDGAGTLAAPWVPDASLTADAGNIGAEFLWAALDCTGGFSVYPAPAGSALVLGELCADILDAPVVGEACVVLGWPLGSEGRKRFAGSAIYGADRRVIARARAGWVQVPLTTWA